MKASVRWLAVVAVAAAMQTLTTKVPPHAPSHRCSRSEALLADSYGVGPVILAKIF